MKLCIISNKECREMMEKVEGYFREIGNKRVKESRSKFEVGPFSKKEYKE